MTPNYPKRLIEVDLPIKRISAHARREKSIRHGHISTLHIWWARRPLAACRAVICASLWPDPADPLCPQSFRDKAAKIVSDFATAAARSKQIGESCDRETWLKWQALANNGGLDGRNEAHWNVLRFALLDFIADFSNWDNSTFPEYVNASRALTQVAHDALGGEPGTRPLVVDPFAGGGAIPLEALRVGADSFASDLNPIPVLLNKAVLEYIPKYGQRLADEVRKWGAWVRKQAEVELSRFYPRDPDGGLPIAYLWARTIRCEGPGCGAEVPLIRSLWLARKGEQNVALQMVPNRQDKRVDFRLIVRTDNGWIDTQDERISINRPLFDGTVRRGSATCPCCGYTTAISNVREQLRLRHGGANDARLMCVVISHPGAGRRTYRLANPQDILAFRSAALQLKEQLAGSDEHARWVPSEEICLNEIRRISVPLYGMTRWRDIFSDRQLLTLSCLARLVNEVALGPDIAFSDAVRTMLALAVGRVADLSSSLASWIITLEAVRSTFGRQALPIVWDFCECQPISDKLDGALEWIIGVIESESKDTKSLGHVEMCSAASHVLPDDSVAALITDPPYYDAIPYAHLSDFFYVWLRRCLAQTHPALMESDQVPKAEEIVVDRPHELNRSNHDIVWYEAQLRTAFGEGQRIVSRSGIGVVVFASKTTASWEAVLKALIASGWVVSGSWPIDTERENKVAAIGQARLMSSVHIVVRARKGLVESPEWGHTGDWRDILQELPRRIHEWMPRLAGEGIVGADAIFACLGPALEIFSRYSRVEKGNGDDVDLSEYLEHVWAAVAREALAMVFRGADVTGFEADARLTAMWLWTLAAPDTNGSLDPVHGEDDADDQGERKKPKASGYRLEYDAARKIAQGLGASLENLTHLVEVKADEATLLPVAERTQHLFGKEEEPSRVRSRKKASEQLNIFAELTGAEDAERVWQEKAVEKVGETTLDRIHQAMILFAAGRGEALKRFIVEDGVGADGKFWRLAQALAALYPAGSEEKRWVEGVMARKKQFGF